MIKVITLKFFICFSFLVGNACCFADPDIRQNILDGACGPRCIISLMKVTGEGKPDYDISSIYRLLDKPMYYSVSLKELKNVLQEFGFQVEGRRMSLDDIRRLKDYAILHVGGNSGGHDPDHFILVQQVVEDKLIFINTSQHLPAALPLSEIEKLWSGLALVIRAGEGMPPLKKALVNSAFLQESKVFDAIKDFGVVDTGTVLEHCFTIKSTEKDFKPIIVTKSCSCLEAKIERNKDSTWSLRLKSIANSAGLRKNVATVQTDGSGTLQRFKVVAFANDSFRLTPPIGYMEVHKAGMHVYDIKIVYYAKFEKIVNFNRIETELGNFSVGDIKVSREEHKVKGVTFHTFEIPLIYTLAKNPEHETRINKTIDFVLDTSDGERIIPLDMIVLLGNNKIEVFPKKLFFLVDKSSAATVEKKLVISIGDEELKTVKLKTEPVLPIQFKIERSGACRYLVDVKLRVDNIGDITAGIHKGNIIIESFKGENTISLSVPITIVMRNDNSLDTQ